MVINRIMCKLKILTDLYFIKQKIFSKKKNKKYFCKSCLWCFSSENVLTKHKKGCLSIYGLQSVKLEKRIIEFKNYFKQIPVPFKTYVDFECNFEAVEIYERFYSEKILKSHSF